MSNHSSLLAKSLVALVALGVSAGALAVESKGALYGDLRLSLDYAEDNSAATGPTYTITDNNSFWGVKGSTTRGGLTVFGAYERFIDADNGVIPGIPVEFTREAFVGLTSFCGTLKYGRHITAYADAGRQIDPFYNTTVSGIGGVGAAGSLLAGGNSHGSSTLFNGDFIGQAFVPNHLAYESPSFWGLTANAAFIIDETNNANQDHDYGGGVEFNDFGVTAGAQFLNANSAVWGPDVEAMRVYAGYAASRFGASASWERVDLAGGADDQDYLMVSGWFGILEGTRVVASYGLENESAAEGDSLRLGVFHDVIENFTVWLAGRRYNEKQFAISGNPDTDVVTLGASYKFNLGFRAE